MSDMNYMTVDEPDTGYRPVVEHDLPMPKDKQPKLSVRDRIKAESQTAKLLEVLGDPDEVPATEEEKVLSRNIFSSGREPSDFELDANPGIARHVGEMLDRYDRELVADATEIRVYLTNRLIQESNSDKDATRLKALDMLGKLSDVGAFMDRKEIYVHNQSTETIEDALRKKIDKLLGKPVEGIVLDA